jgi:hypothetical protein
MATPVANVTLHRTGSCALDELLTLRRTILLRDVHTTKP